ncbi:MAG: hypothetical protein HY645_13510 [Acidobacteria bacterium]|nr:hypothetical protein [Acidobacteriota bacterium]
MIRLGARPQNIYLLGKFYSTNQEVKRKLRNLGVQVQEDTVPRGWGGFGDVLKRDIAKMWKMLQERASEAGFKTIVVLDDGGHCLAGVPRWVLKNYTVVGIEQTTSGLQQLPFRLPVIQVASSAAKKKIEPPMIGKTVIDKIGLAIPRNGKMGKCGVIGLGNIGRAVARELRSRGYGVFAHDSDPSAVGCAPDVNWCEDIQDVFKQADYIFGCTGKDILWLAKWLEKVEGCKTFISCSSEDSEFLSLLRSFNRLWQSLPAPNALDDVSYELPRGYLRILRGGFPINFDGSPESVQAKDIQMTRALLLGAIMQAVLSEEQGKRGSNGLEMLDPVVQRFAVKGWLKLQPRRAQWYPQDTLKGFNQIDWIRENSGGSEVNCKILEQVLLPPGA